MARVPFLGRLFVREYLALLGSLIFVLFEGLIRVITLGLPQFVIRFCYNRSKNLFNLISSPTSKRAREQRKSISHSIANCNDFTDLCALFGYYAEEHVVQTADGYLLGVHRLPYAKGEEHSGSLVNAGNGGIRKPVVYLHHGLLMNSEVWVCITEQERCLPYALVEQGYDVWLGNNRGNKYSKKSTRMSPTSPEFWNFSIDQFAFHDIPDTINYILRTTGQSSLSYIGFSQGTAQAFATLSIHPDLNEKVNLFVALAPAMSPAGLSNGIVDSLVKASPDVLFLAFGRKSILSSATFWQSILYPPIFVRLIDMSLSFLFAWSGANIAPHQKLAAYPHLYSFTSTKSVVHWFQIIRNKSFQMYDDDASNSFSIGASNRYYKVAKFPTRNIKTPIVLMFGGSDSLVDIKVMLRELPKHTIATEVPHYEHLDFLWAKGVDQLVHPHVFEALKHYAAVDGMSAANEKAQAHGLALKMSQAQRFHQRNFGHWSEDDRESSDYDGMSPTATPRSSTRSQAQVKRDLQYADKMYVPSSPLAAWIERQRGAASRPSEPMNPELRHVLQRSGANGVEQQHSGDEEHVHQPSGDGSNGSPADSTGAMPEHRERSEVVIEEEIKRPSTPVIDSHGISLGASRPSVSRLM